MRTLDRVLLGAMNVAASATTRKGQEQGQTLGEYAVVLSVIAVVVAATALVLLSGAIANVFTLMNDCFDASC